MFLSASFVTFALCQNAMLRYHGGDCGEAGGGDMGADGGEGLVIRPLRPEDAGAWLAMRLAALRESPQAWVTTLDEALGRTDYLASIAADFADPAELTVGALESGRVVASGTLSREQRAKVRHVGHLRGMYVVPEARRRGLGRRILAELLAWARAAGLKQVRLEVVSDQVPARRLYEESGFRLIGRHPRALELDGRSWDMDLMLCFLDDAEEDRR